MSTTMPCGRPGSSQARVNRLDAARIEQREIRERTRMRKRIRGYERYALRRLRVSLHERRATSPLPGGCPQPVIPTGSDVHAVPAWAANPSQIRRSRAVSRLNSAAERDANTRRKRSRLASNALLAVV